VTNFDQYSSFKSRGEREIADFLSEQNIDYQYEYPLAIVDRGKTKIWYPDFRLSEYNMIIEYFGMMGNKGYGEQMRHKLKAYNDAGIDGIYLIESTMKGPWRELIIERIEQALEEKLSKIQRHRVNLTIENQV
jgi:hypothetical protein